ncbi:MAG: type II toxin-antitoxin system Phd/YefM family antitoxin [Mycobacteriales bacterium]
MSTLPVAEVKSHLSELVARVAAQHERVPVTVHGRPSAVLVALEDLESLEETIAVLSDPETMRALAQSEADIAAGRVETAELSSSRQVTTSPLAPGSAPSAALAKVST